MNLLADEILKKREEIRSVTSQNSQKYVKQGDLEKKREKAYYEEKERADNEKEVSKWPVIGWRIRVNRKNGKKSGNYWPRRKKRGCCLKRDIKSQDWRKK